MRNFLSLIMVMLFVFSCGNGKMQDGVNETYQGFEAQERIYSGGNNDSQLSRDFNAYVNPDEGKPERIVPRTGDYDEIINDNVFLQGQYMEVGVSECGSFGSTVAAPAGYHANTHPTSYGECTEGCYLGFIADPDKDGWNAGTTNFHGDFFLPGDPEEGFGIRMNGTNYGNYGKCTVNQIPMTSVSKNYLCDRHIAYWNGAINGLEVKQKTKFNHDGTYFTIEVELTNTTGSTINNVYYMRNVDPDNEILWTGDYTTKNTIVFQPHTDPEGKKRAFVKAEGLVHNMFLGLAAVDERARVIHGGFGNRHAEGVWSGWTGVCNENPERQCNRDSNCLFHGGECFRYYQTGTETEDRAIAISFKLDNFEPGDTKIVKYAYILDSSQIDTAFAELTGVLANGIDITEPLYFKICSLSGIDLEIKNHEQYDSWTWNPSANLDQATGPNVVFTPPADGNYVFDVTGTNSCDETVNYEFNIDIESGDDIPPVITSCPGNQTSTASALPDYRGLVEASDGCSSNVRVTQNPPPGTDIGTSIDVTLTVDDFSGNTASCTPFTVTYTGPGTPVATAATNVAQTSATANWNVVGNALSYRIDISNNSGFYNFLVGYEDVNVGNVTNFDITGLNPGTTYYYRVRSVNGDGTSSNSNIISFKAAAPTVQASNIIFSNIKNYQFDISWTRGDGTYNLVFIKQSDYGTQAPVDRTTYAADTVFANGSQIGSTGWYCVYNGTGTNVTVTGLLDDTDYIVKVFEYFGLSGSEYYQTNDSTGNPAVQKTKDTAVVTLGDLTHTYDGTQKSATATTTPNGLTVNFVYVPDTRINAGSYTVTATVDDANYEGSASGTLVINKATPVITTWPTASDITYGDTLADSTLSGGASTPSGTFTFDSPATAPDAGTAGYAVTFTPDDTDNYETVSGTVSVTTNKATPTVTTWPTASDITYGDTLADSTLSGGDSSVPGTFTFDAPSTAPDAGTADFAVTFTPDDTANYETVSGTVSVTTDKATAVVTLGDMTHTYDGTQKSATATTTPSGLTVDFVYTPDTRINAGSYAVTATVDDANYEGSASGTLVINKATPVVTTWPTASDIIYGDTLADSTLSGGASTPSGTFTFDSPATAPDAGTAGYAVTFTPDDTDNYETVSGTVFVTVHKAPATVYLSDLEHTYDGTQKSASAATTPEGLTVNFVYDPDTRINAGSYAVTATVDDPNYEGSTSGTLVINKATPTVDTWPVASDITYGDTLGDSTLSGGNGSVQGAFTFTYPSFEPSVGTADHEVIFTPDDDSYETVTGTVSVTTKKATATITLGNLIHTYDGTQKSASATTNPEGLTVNFVYDHDTRINAGSYAVTATVDNTNYEGNASDTLVINKATPVINWNNPDDIVQGTALSEIQLNASTDVAGTFSYDPGTGTILEVGFAHELKVTFTPGDTDNYEVTEKSVFINVATDLPSITTTEPFDITSVIAKSGGTIISDGGEAITSKGVCISESINPQIIDNCINDLLPDASFVVEFAGLVPGTTYHVRSFATNVLGTAYGENFSFTTKNLYTITYTAGENGSIIGDTEQVIEEGENATPVTAVPEDDYEFDKWSDGSTENPRTDKSVSGNINVEAEFKKMSGLCSNPEKIETLPYIHNSTTTGRESELTAYGNYCGAAEYTSGEYIYSLELKAGDKVEIILTPAEGFDGVLALTNVCGEESDCLQFVNDGSEGENETIIHESTEDETIFIVVEGDDDSDGDYVLEVRDWVEETDDDEISDEEEDVDGEEEDIDQVDDEEDIDQVDDMDEMDDEDTGDSGDSGDSGNTGNTGNTSQDEEDDTDDSDDSDPGKPDDPYEGLKISGGGCSCGIVF